MPDDKASGFEKAIIKQRDRSAKKADAAKAKAQSKAIEDAEFSVASNAKKTKGGKPDRKGDKSDRKGGKPDRKRAAEDQDAPKAKRVSKFRYGKR